MRSHKRRNKGIRVYKLRALAKAFRNTAPVVGFAVALNIIFALGAAEIIGSVSKWAGGSEKLFAAALALELRKGAEGDSVIKAVLPISFRIFSDDKPARNSPENSAPPAGQPTKPQAAAETAPVNTAPAKEALKEQMPARTEVSLTAEGIQFKGEAEAVDAAAILKEPLNIKPGEGPLILIIHTHATEAYANEGSNQEMGAYRAHNIGKGVLRVGEELSSALKEKGYSVIHDRGVYDYPSYTGSYERSLSAITSYLKKYPGIKIVLDIHRDAATDSNGNAVKASVVIDGKSVSQIMMVVGKGTATLENPHWKENLKLAVKLQAALNAKYPGLARPITISPNRYNEHAASGSLLIEIGCNGNTIEESTASARLLAEALNIVLKQ